MVSGREERRDRILMHAWAPNKKTCLDALMAANKFMVYIGIYLSSASTWIRVVGGIRFEKQGAFVSAGGLKFSKTASKPRRGNKERSPVLVGSLVGERVVCIMPSSSPKSIRGHAGIPGQDARGRKCWLNVGW